MAAPTLTGPRVVLRAPRESDLAARQELGWHRQIERGYGASRQDASASPDDARQWFRYVTEGLPAETSWVIEVDGALAGVANLHHLSEPDRNAMFAIGMLSPTFIGCGLGVESSRLVLRHAFTSLGLEPPIAFIGESYSDRTMLSMAIKANAEYRAWASAGDLEAFLTLASAAMAKLANKDR